MCATSHKEMNMTIKTEVKNKAVKTADFQPVGQGVGGCISIDKPLIKTIQSESENEEKSEVQKTK